MERSRHRRRLPSYDGESAGQDHRPDVPYVERRGWRPALRPHDPRPGRASGGTYHRQGLHRARLQCHDGDSHRPVLPGPRVRQLGAKTITLKVWSFNLRARHMYESLGFKETGRAEHAVERDGHWFDEVVYEAPVSMLLERIAAEESARAEGEKLEEQRFEAERQSDRIAQR